jgi:hypothetical protein
MLQRGENERGVKLCMEESELKVSSCPPSNCRNAPPPSPCLIDVVPSVSLLQLKTLVEV